MLAKAIKSRPVTLSFCTRQAQDTSCIHRNKTKKNHGKDRSSAIGHKVQKHNSVISDQPNNIHRLILAKEDVLSDSPLPPIDQVNIANTRPVLPRVTTAVRNRMQRKPL